MRPSALLRSLSTKLLLLPPPAPVAPWPPLRSPFDIWLSTSLDSLLNRHTNSSSFLFDLLDIATAAVRRASPTSPHPPAHYPSFADAFLDDTIVLLDSLNAAKLRAESVRSAVGSLAATLHQPGSASERASPLRTAEMDRRGSRLGKICPAECEVHEELSGAQAMAHLAVEVLGSALGSRRRVRNVARPGKKKKAGKSWVDSVCELLREVKEEAGKRRGSGLEEVRRLKEVISGGSGEVAEEVRRKCRDVEVRLEELERRIDGLYRGLIDLRMGLLQVISEA